jgi:SAM-dependent methyltransferase
MMADGTADGVGAASYDEAFYRAAADDARRSARVIVPLVLEQLQVGSVVDVGCGWGSWLAVFREFGATALLGLDQSAVDPARLEFPRRCFRVVDLRQPISVRRRFDLAVSLEVAEHLPPECAATFIRSLCRLSDAVLFSAAIPHQGGMQHLNEQWPAFWAGLFAGCGFVPVDFLRRRIWRHPDVAWWYAQNIVLYASPSLLAKHSRLRREQRLTGAVPDALVHPKRYLEWVEWGIGVSEQR